MGASARESLRSTAFQGMEATERYRHGNHYENGYKTLRGDVTLRIETRYARRNVHHRSRANDASSNPTPRER